MRKIKLSRRWALLVMAIIGFLVFIWQIPAILRALPSRYVAAYLPDSMQELAARDHVEILPTADVKVDTQTFIESEAPQNMSSSVSEEQFTGGTSVAESGNTSASAGETGQSQETGGSVSSGKSNTSPDAAAAAEPAPTPTLSPTPYPVPTSSRLDNIHHHFQTWNNCGPATLAMGLSYFDLLVTQEQTASVLKPDPEDRNVSPSEMSDYVNNETELEAITRVNGALDQILYMISKGYPVIIELGLDPPGEYRWMDWYGHYLLIVAYDLASEQVWVYDSWFGTSEVPGENADPEGRIISFEDLDHYWNQFNRSYIVIFENSERAQVEEIIGEDLDDGIMWRKSLEKAKAAVSQEPENEYSWFNLGTVYNALGDYERAASAFDQARTLGLPWRMLWYQFGPYEAYYQVGRYEDVILLADTTLEHRPYFEESFYYKGLALQAMGDHDEGLAYLERAVKFNPGFEEARFALDSTDG